jgi:hypothetical protein
MKGLTRDQHLFGPGPKRILALDGGGVRGVLSLCYLERLEQMLRQRAGGDPSFRLCHYFDLIGGTSTGAIIAAGLALGFPVAKLQYMYGLLASSVFRKAWHRWGIFGSKVPARPLAQALEEQFGEVCFGDNQVRTGLMVMTKRLDTGSPWVIHNHPRGAYFDPQPPRSTFANKLYSLRQVVRASTAAPHYFEPERISIAEGVSGAFIDGGVSPHNNPSLQLFMLATIKGYGWNWKTGADDLLLVSVGSGDTEPQVPTAEVLKYHAADLARRALLSVMDDCDILTQTMMQWMSRCLTPWVLDSEVGNLSGDQLGGQELLTYVRYNLRFDPAWLRTHVGIDINVDMRRLDAMDNVKNLRTLIQIGERAAEKQIKPEHLPASFDVPF